MRCPGPDRVSHPQADAARVKSFDSERARLHSPVFSNGETDIPVKRVFIHGVKIPSQNTL